MRDWKWEISDSRIISILMEPVWRIDKLGESQEAGKSLD